MSGSFLEPHRWQQNEVPQYTKVIEAIVGDESKPSHLYSPQFIPRLVEQTTSLAPTRP